MHWVYEVVTALGRGNALFALKAGMLTGIVLLRIMCDVYSPASVILCIPSFLKETAAFAYSTFTFFFTRSLV